MTRTTSAWTPPPAPFGVPVYHYTDAAGLIGIMTNRELWATEATGLNDLSEFQEGLRYLRKWMRRTGGKMTERILSMLEDDDGFWAPSKPSEVFVLSASLDRDDAAQWRLYGGGRAGYSIELDPSVPLGVISGDSSPSSDDPVLTFFNIGGVATVAPWCRVAYTKSEKEEMLQSLLTWARADDEATDERIVQMQSHGAADHFIEDESYEADDRLRTAMGTAAALIKPKGFRSEREVRAVATAPLLSLHTRFRPTEHGIVRYLRLAASDGTTALIKDRTTGRHPDRTLPARGVTVGPTPYFEYGRDTVTALCKQAGIDAPRVRASKVPLRV
ncbi:DUF2971 domain-containing protein [Cellulomonas endometrii]|uniref:DUF2971 domain-containing protein n=1 Tax=Cellulomonas endometrii TaxID=3036301 RepID=UPI0024AD7BD8|nr:DUF2971 domain-containing protein [Cellulomonas endometrii]